MKNLILLIMLSIAGSLCAQSSPQALLDNFFKTYDKDAGQAVKELYATNKWTERNKDDIENVINTVVGLTEDYVGEYYGYELITVKRFSESFELHSYIVKYDRQPIRFIFKFYKPNKQWVLYAFALDDKIDEEIEQAAKLFYLDLE